MSNEKQVEQLTNYMANFIAHIAKKLPDDVIAKLTELRDKEDSPLSKTIYDTMFENQRLAVELNRPSCQDTGVLQFWVKCGTKFPLIDELEGLLKEAVVKATFKAPLRHNSVETFDEYNTGKNVGKGTFHEQTSETRDYFCKYLEACKADGMEVYLLEYTTNPKLIQKIKEYCKEQDFHFYISSSLELR
jgi:tartrate/fumarate subfamily iron-sulfur-dependent hydro-lyase alpha chain